MYARRRREVHVVRWLARCRRSTPPVSDGAGIRLAMHQRFLSNALANEYVGLEEVDDGIWNIICYTTLLGRIDERDGVITGV